MKILTILSVLGTIFLIAAAGCAGTGGAGGNPATPPPTTGLAATMTATLVPATSLPAASPDPYPQALRLKELFSFGTGRVASEGTVYRYWINDTYQWHNDLDNHYYTEKPQPGHSTCSYLSI